MLRREQKALLDVRAARREAIHQLVFSFSLLTEDNNTEIRDTSCPGGCRERSGQVQVYITIITIITISIIITIITSITIIV